MRIWLAFSPLPVTAAVSRFSLCRGFEFERAFVGVYYVQERGLADDSIPDFGRFKRFGSQRDGPGAAAVGFFRRR